MSAPSKFVEPAADAQRGRPRRRVAWVVERLIALGLAALLLRSSFAHLDNPYYFLTTVYSYQAAGIPLGLVVGGGLPFLQILVAACLVGGWWLPTVYGLGFLLFTLFVGVQSWTLHQGLVISCGCFGAAPGRLVGTSTLALAGLAATAAAVGWLGVVLPKGKNTGPTETAVMEPEAVSTGGNP